MGCEGGCETKAVVGRRLTVAAETEAASKCCDEEEFNFDMFNLKVFAIWGWR